MYKLTFLDLPSLGPFAERNHFAFGVAVIMVALYGIGQTIIFLPCDFYLLFFFPRLISEVGDWMSTILPHMVWP